MSLRSVGKRALLACSSWDLLTQHYRHSRLLVLCYHGVVSQQRREDRFGYHNSVSPAEFAAQLEYLGSRYQFIDLAGLAHWMEGKRTARPPVLITFDDGYRNNLTLAAPVLRRFGAPAAFFLATSYINQARLLWTEDITLRVISNPGATLPELAGKLPSQVIPQETGARRATANQLRETLKAASDSTRQTYLDQLELSVDPALVDHELNDFLTWDEARQLAAQGFDIGSHTVTHPVLSRLEPVELNQELAGSRQQIEAELQRPVTSIAFPNGSKADYSPAVMEACKGAGYRHAFTVAERFHEKQGEPLAISRIAVPGHSDPGIFRFRASGLRDLLSTSSA